MTKQKILLANRSDACTQLLLTQLQENYEIITVEKADEILEKANKVCPRVVILDGLIASNLRLSKALRNIFQKSLVIIFFCETDSEHDDVAKTKCQEIAKANQYFRKNVTLDIVIDYLASMLISQNQKPKQVIIPAKKEDLELKVDKFIFDPKNSTVQVGGKKYTLQQKQFQILQLLAQTPGQSCFRDDILEKIWGNKESVTSRVIDVYIRKIREKIGARYILTVPGIGYRLQSN